MMNTDTQLNLFSHIKTELFKSLTLFLFFPSPRIVWVQDPLDPRFLPYQDLLFQEMGRMHPLPGATDGAASPWVSFHGAAWGCPRGIGACSGLERRPIDDHLNLWSSTRQWMLILITLISLLIELREPILNVVKIFDSHENNSFGTIEVNEGYLTIERYRKLHLML